MILRTCELVSRQNTSNLRCTDPSAGVVINEQIDAELKSAAYYLAIGVMSCCGIPNPYDSEHLGQVLTEFGAITPSEIKSRYKAIYLDMLIQSIWIGFQELQKKLLDRKIRPEGGWLEYVPEKLSAEARAMRVWA